MNVLGRAISNFRWNMSLFLKRTTAFALCLLLIACGGGGGRGADSVSSGNGAQSSGDPAPSAFSANVTEAPADGATLTGTVALEIRGSGIANAELLMDSGYEPVLERFTVSADKTVARLNVDTRTIPNGPIRLRISAFDAPAGSTEASEIIAMPARSWTFDNSPAPSGSQAGRAAKCAQQDLPYTDMNDSQPVVCIRATPVSPQLEYEQCIANGYQFDTGYSNPADALPVLRDGSPINKFYCTPPAINGTVNPGCLCVSPT